MRSKRLIGTAASARIRKTYARASRRNANRCFSIENLEARQLLTTLDLGALTGGITFNGVVLNGVDAADNSGFSVSEAGDVNGDGFDDVILGAPMADGPENARDRSGENYVVFGKSDFAADSAIDLANLGDAGFVIYGAEDGDRAGYAVSGGGDIDGDGFDDLIIGAYRADAADNLKVSAGDTHILFGRENWDASVDLATSSDVVIYGVDPDDRSGQAVTSVGDVNGDGFDDLMIGAYQADGTNNAKSFAGDAHLVFGKSDWSETPTIDLADAEASAVVFYGSDRIDFTARTVARAGDANGDGFQDMLISSSSASGPANGDRPFSGESYLIFGKSDWSETPSVELGNLSNLGVTFFGIESLDRVGSGASGVGDVNGDGIDDLAFGAPGGDGEANAGNSIGETYLVFGRADWSANPEIDFASENAADVTLYGIDDDDQSGLHVTGNFDFNADGYDDLMVAAPRGDGPEARQRPGAGESYLIFGKADWSSTPIIDLAATDFGVALDDFGLMILGADANDQNAASISSAGDVNGDGFGDLLIGAPGGDAANNLISDAGESFLVFGSDLSSAVTHLGTVDGETLTGDENENVIVAGSGDDVLLGAGGADVLLGGSGNDQIHVTDLAFRRVDGGGGFDTLVAEGILDVDLSAISDNRLRGIEHIRFDEASQNSLAISRQEVLNISGETNTLRISGGTETRLNFLDEGWVRHAGQEVAGVIYFVYGNGTSRIEVDPDIVMTVPSDSDGPVVESVRVASSTGASDDWTLTFREGVDPEGIGYQVPRGSGGEGQPGQLTPLTWQNIRQLVIEFNEDVGSVTLADFQLVGVNVLSYNITNVDYDAVNFRATLTLAESIGIDKLLLVVRDTVTDTLGNSLDGEWESGVSAGASGDGTAGGDFLFRMNVLPGDTDGSGVVSVLDVSALREGLGAAVGQPSYLASVDFNGSGSLAVDDVAPIRDNLGDGLPVNDPTEPLDGVEIDPLSAVEVEMIFARFDSGFEFEFEFDQDDMKHKRAWLA